MEGQPQIDLGDLTPAPQPERAPVATAATQPTILVVDDERENVESLRDFLADEYPVLATTSATEALRLVEQQPVAVVLTDQRMPEMTGVDLLARVRDRSPDTVRLLTTAYADVSAIIDAINKGSVYRYIVKPWEPDELLSIVRSAVERHELIVERQRLISELQAKNEELARSNALKEAFIRVASHELRSPATVLSAIYQLCMRRQDLPEALRQLLGRGAHATERLNRIVDQLTAVLALGEWNRTLERRPTEIGALVRRVADEVQPFLGLRGLSLDVEVAPDVGSLNLDAEKIHDALDQLVMNAIKFTPDGGHLGLKAHRRSDGWVELAVIDDGVGIDQASLPYVFDPFFTAYDVSRHTSGQYEFGARGLGLGLAVVKGFVAMHGGRVEASSDPGRGTTFVVQLPP